MGVADRFAGLRQGTDHRPPDTALLAKQPLGRCGNDGNVWRSLQWIPSAETRIVGYFDLALEGLKTRTEIEANRAGMIEGAGMHPKAADRPSPCTLDGVVHQEAPRTSANQRRSEAKERQLALSLDAKIQFE